MRIADFVNERIYDITNWTITDRKVGVARGKYCLQGTRLEFPLSL